MSKPLLDREAVQDSISSKTFTMMGDGDPVCGVMAATDAVMELARPMPTREKIASVLREHAWIASEHRCSCGDEEIEFVSHHQAEAVLALLNGEAS